MRIVHPGSTQTPRGDATDPRPRSHPPAGLSGGGPTGYRLVIFDFDGTLADSYAWFAGILDGVADRYGFRRIAPEEAAAVRRMDARALLRHVGLPAWKLPLVARHVRALAARDIAGIGLFPGVDAMLAALSGPDAGRPSPDLPSPDLPSPNLPFPNLALVSSNGLANVRRVLGPQAGRFRHFECGAGLFGKAKRLRRTMRACGAAPEATLAIGDELRDLEAARAAGCAFGAVTWGYTEGDALAAASPDHLFDAPGAIAALVTGGTRA